MKFLLYKVFKENLFSFLLQINEAVSRKEWKYLLPYFFIVVLFVVAPLLGLLSNYNSAFPAKGALENTENSKMIIQNYNTSLFGGLQENENNKYLSIGTTSNIEIINAADFFSVYETFNGKNEANIMKQAFLRSYAGDTLVGTGTIEKAPMDDYRDVVRNSKSHFVGVYSSGFLFQCLMDEKIFVTQFKNGKRVSFKGGIVSAHLLGSPFADVEFTLNHCQIYPL